MVYSEQDKSRQPDQVAGATTSNCPRVQLRIECPECGYPYCEAGEGLHELKEGEDPGHKP